MGDYTQMAGYYDLIMTSGYYDYDAIVGHLARFDQVSSVLEVGAGTGLILERLVARRPDLRIAGIDLTQAMLDVAMQRLTAHPQITLQVQDVVTLCLDEHYDLAFSYGGVWYFVPEPEGGFTMISHLRDEQANLQGLERLAAHLPTGGVLLLGVQAPHADYARPVSNGMQYAQRIVPIEGGFRKHYSLAATEADGGATVMEQTTDYRTYRFRDALDLLDKAGFEYRDRTTVTSADTSTSADTDTPAAAPALFLEFGKR
jgi:SAM-dependent methyltransferase